MPPWGPIRRRVLVAGLRKLGFEGPFSGGTHEFRVRRDLGHTIPNPRQGDIGPELLALVLRQAGLAESGKPSSLIDG